MKLPITTTDPTLDAMDAAQETAQTKEKRRPYLGMSSLGNECSRQLFYGFRWAVNLRSWNCRNDASHLHTYWLRSDRPDALRHTGVFIPG